MKTPFQLGYRMPAEWEPHESTWLSWPTNKIAWPGEMLKVVESIYLQMISALLPHEKVNLLVPGKKIASTILRLLRSRKTTKTQNLRFHFTKTMDVWIRDYGPIFISRRNTVGSRRAKSTVYRLPSTDIAFTKWQFNTWGGKYEDLAQDSDVVDRVVALKRRKRFNANFILEGGSVDVNGLGTCLATEQCLLNPNRNPTLSKNQIEACLKAFLGVTNVIWLKEGIEGDDTDGHVDDISRFVNARTVLTVVEANPADRNHEILSTNLEILKAAVDQSGRWLEILELPMPGRVEVGRGDSKGDRLPASYANFYIANEVVLVPIYSHSNDKIALKVIRGAFPDRKVIGVECTHLVHGLGSIHCVTQQQPV